MYPDMLDFSKQNACFYKNFVNHSLLQKMMATVFPGYSDVKPEQIFIYNYIVFRQKYLIELIVQYKNMLIPLQLDFVTDVKRVNDRVVEFPKLYGYKSRFYVDNGKYNSNFFLTVMPRESTEYYHENHVEFFGEKESEIFTKFYKTFYKKGQQSINYTQRVYDSFIKSDRNISLDIKSYYSTGDHGHYINMYTDDVSPTKKASEFNLDVKSNINDYGAKGKFEDFNNCLKDDLKTIPELFRKMFMEREDVTEELIPLFDSHIELFDYYDKNLETIRTIKKMSDI